MAHARWALCLGNPERSVWNVKVDTFSDQWSGVVGHDVRSAPQRLVPSSPADPHGSVLKVL